MLRFREEIDADRTESRMRATNYPTVENQSEVYCEMCGEVYFVDEIISDRVAHAIRKGFDNPFVCDLCRDELDYFA